MNLRFFFSSFFNSQGVRHFSRFSPIVFFPLLPFAFSNVSIHTPLPPLPSLQSASAPTNKCNSTNKYTSSFIPALLLYHMMSIFCLLLKKENLYQPLDLFYIIISLHFGLKLSPLKKVYVVFFVCIICLCFKTLNRVSIL